MSQRAKDHVPDLVAARWTPVIVGGREARPQEDEAVHKPPQKHDPELPVVPERLAGQEHGAARAQHRARIGTAVSIALHLGAAVLAISFVEPDAQLAGEGTFAQVIESGIVIVPVQSVTVTPSSAAAQKADTDTPTTDQTAESVKPAEDDTAVTPDSADAAVAEAEPTQTESAQAETVSPDAATEPTAPPEVAAVQPETPAETALPDPAAPQVAEQTAATPVESEAPVAQAQSAQEDVVVAAAPDVLAAPSAEDSVAAPSPEPVQEPTPDQLVRPVEPETVQPDPPPPPPAQPQPVRKAAPPKPAATEEPRKRSAARASEAPAPTTSDARRSRSARSSAAGSVSMPRAAQGVRPGTKGSGGPGEIVAGRSLLPSYAARVQAHYARFKSYPAAARDREVRGTVRIQFTLNAAGAVTSVRLVSSSGAPALDQAALDAARRASPFPARPPELGTSSIPFTVPVRFNID